MKTPGVQISLTTMLLLVACAAGNIWLFRQGVLWGILGLNVTKHVLTAYLCKVLGVNSPGNSAEFKDYQEQVSAERR